MLVEYLKKKYSEELPNVDFTNLYSLTAKALKKVKVEKQDILFFLKHLEDYTDIWNYDSVIIDEGQDFNKYFYQVCYKITKNKRLVWAYDDFQNIFDVKIQDGCGQVLNIPYKYRYLMQLE